MTTEAKDKTDSAHPSDNELIAQFMGFEVTSVMPVSNDRIWMLPYIDTSLGNPYFGPHRSEQMRFDTYWDWLMPVVEKIHNNDMSPMAELPIHSRIEDVYQEVVRYIRWYNANQPKP